MPRERCDHVGSQHAPAEVVRSVVGEQKRELGLVGQAFDDEGDHLDQLADDVQVGGDRLDLCDESLQRDLGGREEEFLAAREVPIHRPARDAEDVGDVGDGGVGGAALVDQHAGRIDDALARLGVVGRRRTAPSLASHGPLTLSVPSAKNTHFT